MTSFAETSMLMGKQKVAPIAVWDKAESQIEACAMFLSLFLGDDGVHPATYDIFLLLEERSRVSPRLQVQTRKQPNLPSTLLCLIHQDFNESFLQALERRQQVR